MKSWEVDSTFWGHMGASTDNEKQSMEDDAIFWPMVAGGWTDDEQDGLALWAEAEEHVIAYEAQRTVEEAEAVWTATFNEEDEGGE